MSVPDTRDASDDTSEDEGEVCELDDMADDRADEIGELDVSDIPFLPLQNIFFSLLTLLDLRNLAWW